MPDFSCDVDVISAFTPCGTLQICTLSRTVAFPSTASPMYSLLHVEQMTTYTKSLLSQVISPLR